MDCSWPTLEGKSGTDLTQHYIDVLRALGQQRGLLGDIFTEAMSRFTNPVSLKKLIGLIDETEWTGLDIDVKAAAFEGLLEKAASEGKKGAGQYFHPAHSHSVDRALRETRPPRPQGIHDVRPWLRQRWVSRLLLRVVHRPDKGWRHRPGARPNASSAVRITDRTLLPRPRRLALMNLYLHGLEPEIKGAIPSMKSPTAAALMLS